MAYYAEILNDLVVTINVVNDDVPNGAQFCTDLFGGMWVQTFNNLPNKNFAVIGDTYDAVKNNFIAPQPYPSWTLDSNDIWQPPVPQPPAPPQTYWDEDTQTWQPFVQP